MPLKIFKRGEIWHYRGSVAGRRLRGSTRTEDKARAQRITAEIETKQWKQQFEGPGANLTFAQAAIMYRNAQKSVRFLERIEDYWRDTLVSTITAGAIRNASIKLFPNVRAATRNRQVIVPTQAIINHAAELDMCSKISVKRFRVETQIKKPVTRDWVITFAKNASPHLGALCIFMFGTGARISEAIDVRWKDINLQEATALIRQTKISTERTAHLPPLLVTTIANIPSNRLASEKVFRYSSRETARHPWNDAIKRAGITPLSFHSCRHGFATTLLQSGVDVVTVAKTGGWKDVTMVVKTYAHAMTDRTITNVIFDTKLARRQPTK